MIYLYTTQQNECPGSAALIIPLALLNLFWILVAFIGIASINTRKVSGVKRFFTLLFLSGTLRGVFYIFAYHQMKEVHEQDKWQCASIYQGEMFAMQAILEIFATFVILHLTKTITKYLQGKKLLFLSFLLNIYLFPLFSF